MKRTSTVFGVGTALFLGALFGAAVDDWLLTRPAEAEARMPENSEALYRGLQEADNPLREASRVLSRIASLTSPSVVHIQSRYRSPRGREVEETGSGVIVRGPDSRGHYVVTNRHVVAAGDLNHVDIYLDDGRRVRPRRLWSDAASDIAVMEISARNLQAARWGDSDRLQIGDIVLAMGSPFGLSQSVTLGIISAKGRRSLDLGTNASVLNQDFLQTDAAINPGNSGGPLIDLEGRVVGINTAIASGSGGNDGIGFSIPANLVRTVVDQLVENGRVRRAYLGVKLDPEFDVDAAQRLRLRRLRGARVAEVYPDTPAARAGLRFNDVVLEFDGIEVQDESHLINLVSLTPVGKRVTLSVFRDGKQMTVKVLLADRSELRRRS